MHYLTFLLHISQKLSLTTGMDKISIGYPITNRSLSLTHSTISYNLVQFWKPESKMVNHTLMESYCTTTKGFCSLTVLRWMTLMCSEPVVMVNTWWVSRSSRIETMASRVHRSCKFEISVWKSFCDSLITKLKLNYLNQVQVSCTLYFQK